MHELGVLYQIMKTVNRIAEEKHVRKVKSIVLEVGERSGFVPQYLMKLFPVAVDAYPILRKAKLHICLIKGNGLVIKEIGY